MVFRNAYVGRLFVLILMFSVGVFASGGENNNDISNKAKSVNTSDIKYIPYLSRNGWGYDGFIFTSSGKEFYTYKNGILHHWQLMPVIKHLDSISINFFVPKKYNMKFGIQSLLYLSSEEDKMLFYRKDFIEIWDLKKKKMIANKKINSMAGVMTNKGFFTVDKNFLLQQWSLDGLEEVKSKVLRDHCNEYIGKEWDETTHPPSCKPAILVSDKKDIYMISYHSISHINPETLTEMRHQFIDGPCRNITADKKFLFSCKGNHFKLEDFTYINYREIENRKRFPTNYFLRFFVFDTIEIYERPFNRSMLSSRIGIRIFKNNVRPFLGGFYHNDKGNWYFKVKKSQKGKYIDSDLSLKELEMCDVDDYSNKKRMSKKIYNKYFKKINFEDLKNGKN